MAFALALSTCLATPLAAASVEDLPIKSSVMGRGETVIFVHGWTCDETAWDAQVEYFSENYRVVTLDLPGHGISASPAKEDFSMDLFAAAVEAVRNEVGADKVVLVGHSMGGAVIRQYAVNYPDHVAGLVAVDGPLDMRTMAGVNFGELTLEQRGQFVDSMFVEGTSEELRAEIRGVMLSAPADTAHGAMNAMLDPSLQTDDVIAAPALTVLAGQTNFPIDDSQREVLTDWQHTSVPGTGHFLMMEKPDEFNALLESFLTERAQF
ncbi:alpha/beta fold hydrolase [Alteraurantiacibacter aquimixticola]|nr:alpha/beta hydrolase [Alteraurantiacibacter aquimixticola]